MTSGFQQQDPAQGFRFPKSEPAPQHGQQPDKAKAQPTKTRRAVDPKPGH